MDKSNHNDSDLDDMSDDEFSDEDFESYQFDEYSFDEETDADDNAEETMESEKTSSFASVKEKLLSDNLKEKLKGMLVPLVIGTIIVLFGLTKLWGVLFPPTATTSQPNTQIIQPVAVTKTVEPSPAQTPAENVMKSAPSEKTQSHITGLQGLLPSTTQTDTQSISDKVTTAQTKTAVAKKAPVKSAVKPIAQQTSAKTVATPDVSASLKALAAQKAQLNAQAKQFQAQLQAANSSVQKAKSVNTEHYTQLATQVATLNDRLAKVEQQNAEFQHQLLQTLQSQQGKSTRVEALSDNMRQLQKNLSHATAAIQSLADNLNQQMKAKEAQKAKAHQAIQMKKQKKANEHYYVKAIVPGRAWLANLAGTTHTVAVGDTVPGYGHVQAMDVYTGTVKMSSGAVFHYGIAE